MASIENRSRFQVKVKNRDDLTKNFAHTAGRKAKEYVKLLESQKLKPKLTRLDDNFIIRIRRQGLVEQTVPAKSLEEAKLFKEKLAVEHSQGLFIDYSKAQKTTLADLLIRYLREESPRNKSFEVEAYKINAMLEDVGLPRQSIAEIIAKHKNPCSTVKNMKIRTPTQTRVRASASAAIRFILKPFAAIEPDDFTEFIDERCQDVAEATVDRELDIFSAVCNKAIKKWRIHVLQNPMDGVERPKYFNERDRRLKKDEEERLLLAASVEDERISRETQLTALASVELNALCGKPTKYRRRVTRKSHMAEVEETYRHIPWYETFIQFQLMTGARRTEALELLWENVDLDEQTAFIPMTKNGRPRKLPLRKELVAMLRELPRNNERVFDITSNGLRHTWKRICSRAGFVGENTLLVHDLRHEAISRVAEAGSNLPGGFTIIDLQHFSGHRDLRMLLRYAHLCTRGLAQRLDAAFHSKNDVVIHHGRKRLAQGATINMADVANEAPHHTEENNAPDKLPVLKCKVNTVVNSAKIVDFSKKLAG